LKYPHYTIRTTHQLREQLRDLGPARVRALLTWALEAYEDPDHACRAVVEEAYPQHKRVMRQQKAE